MTQIFETVLTMSLGASVLALLVLGARALIGRRQTVLLTILFAMLIAKLIFPLSIESPTSIQNLFALQNESTQNSQTYDIIPQIFAESVSADTPNTEIPADADLEAENTEAEIIPATVSAAPKAWQPTALEIGAIIWLSGIAFLASYIAISNIRFMRKIRKNREYSTPRFNALLEECKNAFGMEQRISVIRVSEINTAAVCGIFRPKLLISPHTFDSLSLQEKRHIIMHELSHIKRKDTFTCLIMTILNIVHWFNPILWIAFILMRKDLEIMCDAKVLRKIGQAERHSYADTLLHLIKKTNTRNVRLVTALFMSKTSIKRRIIMIAKYKKNSPLFIALALLVTITVAITGCTTGMQNTAETDEQPELTEEIEAIAEKSEPTESPAVEIIEPEPTPVPVIEPVLMTSFTLDYSDYKSVNTYYNVKKALGLLQGIVIAPGTELSLNEVLGPRNKVSGWKEAAGISGGAFIQQYGGGVTAVSNALYNAAIRAELEVIDSSRHSIMSSYVDGGLDATISTGGPDLVIKNPYDIDVLIEGSIEDGIVTIEIYGPPRDYTVDFTSEQISTEDAPEEKYYYNTKTTPDGKPILDGESVIYAKSRKGLAFQVYKTWYDLNGTETKTEEFYYHMYRPITGRAYVNGPDPAE